LPEMLYLDQMRQMLQLPFIRFKTCLFPNQRREGDSKWLMDLVKPVHSRNVDLHIWQGQKLVVDWPTNPSSKAPKIYEHSLACAQLFLNANCRHLKIVVRNSKLAVPLHFDQITRCGDVDVRVICVPVVNHPALASVPEMANWLFSPSSEQPKQLYLNGWPFSKEVDEYEQGMLVELKKVCFKGGDKL